VKRNEDITNKYGYVERKGRNIDKKTLSTALGIKSKHNRDLVAENKHLKMMNRVQESQIGELYAEILLLRDGIDIKKIGIDNV